MATLTDHRTVKTRFGYMPFMWVRVGLAQGEVALAQGEYQQAIVLMDELYRDLTEAGIWYLRPDVLHLKGRALLGQGTERLTESHAVLQAARTAAETLGSRRVTQSPLNCCVKRPARLWRRRRTILGRLHCRMGFLGCHK